MSRNPFIDLPSRKAKRHAAGCTLWLFVCFQSFYLVTASGRLHTIDEYETYYMTEGLAERGDLALPPQKRFFGRRGNDGRFHAPYGPLPAFVSLPFYLAGKAVSGILDAPPDRRESLLWFFTSLSNTTVSAATVALFALLAWRLGASVGASTASAVVLGVATYHWHYATTFFSEPLSALLLLLSAHLLVGYRKSRGDGVHLPSLVLAGLPLALLAMTRLTTAIFFPVFGVAVLTLVGRDRRRRIVAAGAYSLLPTTAVFLYLLWNHARFGDLLQPGYPTTVEGGGSTGGFDTPLFLGLFGFLFSPGKGLVLFALPAVIGLCVSKRFVQQTKPLGAFLLAPPVCALFFYSSYRYWEGGYCWGPRYLLPAVPLWVLPLAFVRFPRRTLVWATPAMVLSIGVQALGTAVSFLECQVNRGYYTADFRYDIRYSALAETADVLFHYTKEAAAGRFLHEAEGLGWDRWFFFLYKSGFSGNSLAAVVSGLLLVLAVSVVMFWRTARRGPADDEGIESPPAGDENHTRGDREPRPGRDGGTPALDFPVDSLADGQTVR